MFRNINTRKVKKNYKLITLIAVVAVSLILLIVLLATLLPRRRVDPDVNDRIECPGFKSKESCEKSGCSYDYIKNGPSCYMKSDRFRYKVLSQTAKPNGIILNLEATEAQTPYGLSFPRVKFEVTYITQNIIRFKLSDGTENYQPYEVPVQDYFPLLRNETNIDANNLSYKISYSNEADYFHMNISRLNGVTLWDTSIGGLIMSEKYLQIASYLPSKNIYGLGEHVHETFRHSLNYVSWPLFSRDRPPMGGQKNLYGVHPFYTCLENDGKSHGVLLLNSNAMEVTLLPTPAISFRTIGGVLDFFVFVGENPEHVVQLYTSLIGRPILPPYWGLGFQLSRYGYNKLENVKAVVERTRNAGIMQDVQFLDIDHMEGRRDFTWDNNTFAGLPEYIKETKEKYGLKWIIILDPAIEVKANYSPYESGINNNVFIKRPPMWPDSIFPPAVQDLNVTFGRVWPRDIVAFPDFFLKSAKQWWINQIVEHYSKIPFDGLWIDMNEPANFQTNEDDPEYCKWDNIPKDQCWALKCPTSPYDDPPYNPLEKSESPRLSTMTLCMESIQGEGDKSYRHYDVHSLYGWSQTLATKEAAETATGTRSLVISRSTYPSSGNYSGHWLGDNRSQWPDLHRSIIGMLEFNLFGIPYIGADICGFFEDTTPEMCKRWMQLGAFYPFFRNHNGLDQKDQDPVALGEMVTEASKRAVERRYNLLPYLYTLFYRAHVDGNTVVRPLFHEFPTDEITWDIDKQFMWGKSLLISPILKPDQSSLSLYLPEGEWWHFEYEQSRTERLTGQYVIKTGMKSNIPVHIRGGTILPTQQYVLRNSSNEDTRNLSLYIFPQQDKASGELFIDDGLSKNTIENNLFILYQFSYANCSVKVTKLGNTTWNDLTTTLMDVYVFKVKTVTNVEINNTTKQFTLDDKLNVLKVKANMELREITSIAWADKKNGCQMLT